MSAVYRNLEQQAKDTLKNIVFRCPSQRGKKNTLDYSYRTFPGAVNLREIAVDNLLIPAVRLRTGEIKKLTTVLIKFDGMKLAIPTRRPSFPHKLEKCCYTHRTKHWDS